jgi:hypothetical protein
VVRSFFVWNFLEFFREQEITAKWEADAPARKAALEAKAEARRREQEERNRKIIEKSTAAPMLDDS